MNKTPEIEREESTPRLGRLGRPHISGSARVWVLNVLIVIAAILIFPYTRSLDQLREPIHVPWWALAGMFYLAESHVVHLEFRKSAHSFSLSEIPLVIGLFFTSPGELVLAQLLGGLIALTFTRRQSPLKIVFNAANFTLQAILALTVFHSLVVLGDPIGPAGWLAAFLASSAATLEGLVSIALVISLTGEGTGPRRVVTRVLGLGLLITLANTSLGLIGVAITWRDPLLVWLLAVPAVTLFVAYRGYTEQRHKRESLEFLNRATRVAHGSIRMEEMMLSLLGQARAMFTADIAEITFFPEDEDHPATRSVVGPGEASVVMESVPLDPSDGIWARIEAEGESVLLARPIVDEPIARHFAKRGIHDAMITPLRSDRGVIGMMTIANHLGDISTFDESDLKLFETLANHASVSLDNARLVARLEESLVRLTEINRLKDDFVAAVSHELRTPLTGIQGYVKTLIRSHHKLGPEQVHNFLEIIDRQGERLRSLIEDLLSVSRIESGRDSASSERLDLETLATHVTDELLTRARNHKVEIEIAFPLPSIATDVGKVHQIVSNLVENAIKYSPEGTVVRLKARVDEGGALVSVEDEGPGIPLALQGRVFDRFFQIDQSSTREVGGTGLGLYICKRLAEVLGGRVWLERSDHQGSVFNLWIPAAPPGAGHASERTTVLESSERSPSEPGPAIPLPIENPASSAMGGFATRSFVRKPGSGTKKSSSGRKARGRARGT